MTPKATEQLPRTAWWDKEDPDEAARAMYSHGQALEMASYGRRYRHALLYRLVTGEDAPSLFGYWMSARVAPAISALGIGPYVEPAVNVVASSLETFENRIGTLRPFVEMLPSGGDFAIREACGIAEDYIDTLFDDCRLYGTTRVAFRDGGTWGTSPVKVTPHPNGKELLIERIIGDELLVDDAAAFMGRPASLIQRRYMTRDDAMATLVDSAASKDRDEIVAAIKAAPPAFYGPYWTGTPAIEQIALLEGWRLVKQDGTPGRRILALPHKIIEDEPWKRDHYPFAFFRWTPQSLGFWGQSAAMSLLPYQVTINKRVDRLEGNADRMAFARWMVEGNTKLRAEQLGGRPGAIVRFQGVRPEAIVPPSNGPEEYSALQSWIDRAYMRVGLNQQAASGLKQPGITSGTALRTMLQIEDARNKSLQIALEGLVKDIAQLAIEAAEDMNLTVRIPGVDGRSVNWRELKLTKDKARVTVFPINALVNDPEGRQQQIAEWYADGLIDKRARFRLQDMPDLRAYATLATAQDDLIESTLDKIVSTGKYLPPDAYDDPAAALNMARSRRALEKRLGAPRKTLRLLESFIAALADLSTNGQQFLQANPGITPPAGMPQDQGAAPVPPPVQTAPSLPAPAQLPAAA